MKTMKRESKIIVLFVFLLFSNMNAQSNLKSETLTINWPKEEDWHIVDQQDNDTGTMTTLILLKDKETIPNHSEIGTTYIYHKAIPLPIDAEIEELYQSLKKYAPTAKKTIIEKDENAEYPWIISKIEGPTGSMINYAIKGKSESYSSFWSTKEKELTPKSQEKWVEIFKSSKIISK
jgi:hypothetical protein